MRPVFFVDRALGAHVFPDALEAKGIVVERHRDHFAHDAPDEVWIAAVARQGWFALSQDERIYRNPVQRAAVIEAGLGYFVLTGANAKAETIAANFVASYTAVERFVERVPRPFVASVQRGSTGRAGRVVIRWPRPQ